MATKNVIVKYNCEGQGFPKTTRDQDFENDMKKTPLYAILRTSYNSGIGSCLLSELPVNGEV